MLIALPRKRAPSKWTLPDGVVRMSCFRGTEAETSTAITRANKANLLADAPYFLAAVQTHSLPARGQSGNQGAWKSAWTPAREPRGCYCTL